MSDAAVERSRGDRPLIAEADGLMDRNPGYRFEILLKAGQVRSG